MSAINLDKGVLEYLKDKYPNIKEEFFYDPKVKLSIGHFVSNIPERNNFLLKDTIVYIEQNAPRSGKTTTVIAGIKTYPEYPYFRAIPYPYNSIGKEVKLYDVNNVIEAFEEIFKDISEHFICNKVLRLPIIILFEYNKDKVISAYYDGETYTAGIINKNTYAKDDIDKFPFNRSVCKEATEVAKLKLGEITITPKLYLMINYLQQYLMVYFEHVINAKR
jgi:hypothetical protein